MPGDLLRSCLSVCGDQVDPLTSIRLRWHAAACCGAIGIRPVQLFRECAPGSHDGRAAPSEMTDCHPRIPINAPPGPARNRTGKRIALNGA
jgi:hypothetical protein